MFFKVRSLTAVVFLILGLTSACSDDHAPTLLLGTNIWTGYEPLYLARNLGLFDDHEIRLVEYISASEVIRGFTNKSIDAAALTLDEALLLKQRGLDIKIILVTDISDGADTIIGRANDHSLADLKGSRIGVESSALGAYFLTRALEENGMTRDDVQIEHLHVHEHEAAFLSGEVDAVVTFEPARTNLLLNGGKELFTSRQIPGEIVDVIVVSGDIIDHQADHISLLINGWFEALHYLQSNPLDAARIIDLRQKIGPEKVIESYGGLKLPDRSENIEFLLGETATLKDIAERLQQVMVTQALYDSPVAIEELFAQHISGLMEN